ncbi:MAG TPA: hypothetical protein VFQ43_05980, partial [Nitrososphaera sp.]|nr:hypothetical protein [Nitrososphaera sp.]
KPARNCETRSRTTPEYFFRGPQVRFKSSLTDQHFHTFEPSQPNGSAAGHGFRRNSPQNHPPKAVN